MQEITSQEENKIFIHSYKEQLVHNSRKPSELVKEIMQKIKATPTNWEINFDSSNQNERRKIFRLFQKFFENTIGQLVIINEYKNHYRINNEWRTRALTSGCLKI